VPGGVARALPKGGKERDRLAAVSASLLEIAHRMQTVMHETLNTHSAWQAFFSGEAFSLPLASLALFGQRGSVDWLGEQVHVIAPDGSKIARFSPSEHEAYLVEHLEPWSSQAFTHLKAHAWPGLEGANAPGLFRVGPLARLNASGYPLSGAELAERLELVETHSLASSVWAGLIELLDASEMLATLSQDEVLAGVEVRSLPTRAQAVGEGAAAVEGPAGLVLHAYRTDARGIVQQARVLDPATLNNAARNLVARRAAMHILKRAGQDEGELRLIEFAVAAC
jgi:F420-non-reducing hydrogenase large subunit